MEETQQSFYESISLEMPDLPPKIDFDINIVHTVTFPDDYTKPEERDGDNGKYCIFPVKENNVNKVIMTSAYSLLRGLKKLEPLATKTVSIVKRMEKNKQHFDVELAT